MGCSRAASYSVGGGTGFNTTLFHPEIRRPYHYLTGIAGKEMGSVLLGIMIYMITFLIYTHNKSVHHQPITSYLHLTTTDPPHLFFPPLSLPIHHRPASVSSPAFLTSALDVKKAF